LTASSDFPTTAGAFDTTYNGGGADAVVSKLNSAGSGFKYSSYLGGASFDAALGIAVDETGSAYVTGSGGPDFPTTPGAVNTGSGGFTTKLNVLGSGLLYSAQGVGGADVAVDPSGSAYLIGGNLVTKLNSTGSSILYSTSIGEAGYGDAIAVDASGSAWVTGQTASPSFPTTPGAFDTTLDGIDDAFVVKLSTGGSPTYSTYLGGSAGELGRGIAVDSNGNAYVTGDTGGVSGPSNFPTTAGAFDTTFNGPGADAFLTKFVLAGNQPPDCSKVAGNPKLLWPPNHKYRLVMLSGATDPDSDTVTVTITGVTQDEPLNGLGDGDTAPDARRASVSNQIYVRAERSGLRDGRVYRIAFTGSDGKGGTCSGTALVGAAPHDQGKGSTPVDSAPPSYNSFGP
jgi:hypothetical protein